MKNLNMSTSLHELKEYILKHGEIDQLLIYTGTRFAIVYAYKDDFSDEFVQLSHNQINFTLSDVKSWLILQ